MPGDSLAEIRGEIDRIDAAMHGLLMERGATIDRLIATKRSAPTTSAFRPDREAAMLRALAERHAGSLPLDAVEGIWRVIISTFTHAQSPFAVHADASLGAERMRDSARFHFGFTVPYRALDGAEAVVAAVAAARGDLGLLGLEARAPGAWWRLLEPAAAPKVIARLPFLPRPTHPAPAPVLVIAGSASETVSGGATVFSARLRPAFGATALADEGITMLAAADGSVLMAVRHGVGVARLAAFCEASPASVGGYPEPFEVEGGAAGAAAASGAR